MSVSQLKFTDFMSYHHIHEGHTENGFRFKVSSETPDKRVIESATPGLAALLLNGSY